MKKVLIIDDNADICLLLSKFLTKKGFKTATKSNGTDAEAWLKKNEVDLVICDFKLPDYNGLELLEKIKIIDSTISVIIITGYSDVRVAVEAVRKGAFDYVTKPLYPDEILATIHAALEEEEVETTVSRPSKKMGRPKRQEFVIGPSAQSSAVQKHIDLIAPTDLSVIIQGATGTGKEYVAKSIHQKSNRADQKFVALDCGALPKELAGSELFGHVKGSFTGAINDKEGCFELANGGTLFLDEIGNLTYDNQIKLLRALQERSIRRIGGNKEIAIDVRIIVATNENLKKTIENGDFREDIYHRLNEFKIELSPIRERPDDVAHFAKHFLQLANQQLNKSVSNISLEAMDILQNHQWHGNLRELNNVIKRAVLMTTGDEIKETALPEEIRNVNPDELSDDSLHLSGSLKEIVNRAEKKAIIRMLERTNGNKRKTAELLDIDRKTLYNKLKSHGIA
ncbi:MAG: sigma-54 dependent transcriptional regulator [Cyclobacteriaceae bacterium]